MLRRVPRVHAALAVDWKRDLVGETDSLPIGDVTDF